MTGPIPGARDDFDPLTTDPQTWAHELVGAFDGVPLARHPHGPRELDEETVAAWFAHAIEAGRRAGQQIPDLEVDGHYKGVPVYIDYEMPAQALVSVPLPATAARG